MSDNKRPVLVPRFGLSGLGNQRGLFPEVLQHNHIRDRYEKYLLFHEVSYFLPGFPINKC